MSSIPTKFQRYVKFIGFLVKYWNSDVMGHAASTLNSDVVHDDQSHKSYEKPEELIEDLKDMGPTWVKLGQLLSTRPDLLPEEYLQALSTLQDNVEQVSYSEILPIVEEELGVRISKGFASFDEMPLASASIGQVHKAILRSGKEVVVKIQRPGIRQKFVEDLDTIQEIVDLAMKYSRSARKYALGEILEELRHILLNELDYNKEAQNLVTLGENLREFRGIIVPMPVPDYCTSRVLTMEYIKGRKVTEISPLIRTEVDLRPLVDTLVECYLKQIIIDGFAHADPHPGNVHLTDDNMIVLMDLGMVARFSNAVRDKMLKLLIAIGNADGDAVASTLLQLSAHDREVDTDHFRRNVNRLVLDNSRYSAKEMQTGKLLIQINQLAAEEGIKIGAELNVVGKILGNLDRIVAVLSPHFDLRSSIREHLEDLLRRKLLKELRPENMLEAIVELKNLGKNLPARINAITEKIANNELEIRVNAIDEKRFTDGFQKVANRITLGLIIASIIIGAAMLMRVPSTFSILGYPGLAMLFFITAAAAGFYLIYIIIFKDEDFRKRH
ncbi:AarF/UbiB family protein [Nemorincola caseinilytica]|uniref:AarF/UbiB family protein n=1 Tax=Nemorincola caseinilytica TaxID=2054315 RepID=A0ABP8NQD1_9BACT